MMLPLAAIGPVAASALVTALWQGIVLAIVMGICLRLTPKTTAALRFGLWGAVLLVICALPVIEGASLHGQSGSLVRVDPRWSLALAAAWSCLSLLKAVELVWHGLRLRTLSLDAKPVEADPGVKALLCLSARQVQLCTSNRMDRPGVIGFFHPRILIPAWLYKQLTVPELEQVVLHEMEHLRRGDDWLNLLQKLALVVFPLNPVLYWIERQLCVERELACDEGVVRRTRAPRLYATCLAKLAEHGLDRRAVSLALGVMERQSELGRRVAGVLRGTRVMPAGYRFALTSTMAAVLLGGSAELARYPQVVSFAAVPRTASHVADASPAGWVAAPVLYTDAAMGHVVQTSLPQAQDAAPQRARRKHKVRTTAPTRAAVREEAAYHDVLASAVSAEDGSVPPSAATPAVITPTLVRYALVRVQGGWLLLQL